MAFFTRTKADILSRSLDRLSQNTNITQLAPGAKARFILETLAEEQGEQFITFDENLMQAFIKYANGRMLDFFGDMLNNPRREATHAEDETDNFMFYVTTGTFGDINGDTNFVIPAGTIVSTIPYDSAMITPGIEEQPIIEYTTTQAVTCRSDESFVYVPVRASVEGTNSSVPRNVLKQHNYARYLQSEKALLKCINRYDIDTGEDRETDEAYRYRLQNLFRARSLAIPPAIRLAALSVPGVSDIKEVVCEQGPGTFSIYIKSVTPTVSPKLLNEVSANVGSVTAEGIRGYILAPETIGLEFVANVTWSQKATAAERSSGYVAMREAVERELNRTQIGQQISFLDLIDIMRDSYSLVSYIGGSKPNTFESIYAYRSSPDGGVTRSIISSDIFVPLYNERVILETSGKYRGIQFLTR